jgi:hypothetical protein
LPLTSSIYGTETAKKKQSLNSGFANSLQNKELEPSNPTFGKFAEGSVRRCGKLKKQGDNCHWNRKHVAGKKG